MSFRLFAYYCAICGGWAAFFGWMLGRLLSPATETTAVAVGLRGMALGLMVALGLSLLDSFWVFGLNRILDILMRVGVAIFVGAIGGLIGGMFGQWLYEYWFFFYVIGWTLTGMLAAERRRYENILNGALRASEEYEAGTMQATAEPDPLGAAAAIVRTDAGRSRSPVPE